MNFIFLLLFMILQTKLHFVPKATFFNFLYNKHTSKFLAYSQNSKAAHGVNQMKSS